MRLYTKALEQTNQTSDLRHYSAFNDSQRQRTPDLVGGGIAHYNVFSAITFNQYQSL